MARRFFSTPSRRSGVSGHTVGNKPTSTHVQAERTPSIASATSPSKVSPSPKLDTSEVSLDSERTLDDVAHVKPCARATSPYDIGNVQDESLTTRVVVSAEQCLRAAKAISDRFLPSSPLVYAAAAGLVLPRLWTLYGCFIFVLAGMTKLLSMWASFVWNDREVVFFRRSLGGSVRRLKDELQRTLRGSYTHQVMASYIYYFTTSPGESFLTAFIRYKTHAINNRLIDEFEKMKNRFYGHDKDKRKASAL